jgi:UDP-galactopyranose mutase
MMKYDYLIVGTGIFGSVFAYEAHKAGKKVLMIEKRNHIGGNAYTKDESGIKVHLYGPHIFHTSNKHIWDYVNKFAHFNHFINSPLANYQDRLYSLPFNMYTFNQLWGITKPIDAIKKIKEQQQSNYKENPMNLEEQAINLVGIEIYNKFIKGYTEKQWGRSCLELPPFIIKRIPVRFTYNNNYFNDIYQGIPIGGYTSLLENMLKGIEIQLNTDYLSNKAYYDSLASKVLYTGCIDSFYDYKYGMLEYRSLRFEHERLEIDNYQGNAVINFTESNISYTRVIEHKHFDFGMQNHTIVTKEYPDFYDKDKIPYYPINNEKNQKLYFKYKELADLEDKYIFGGRLAEYKYYDMDQVIESALNLVNKEIFKKSE